MKPKMSQAMLAARLGVSRETLNAWAREGLPYVPRARIGGCNAYDLRAVVRWLLKSGKGLNHLDGIGWAKLPALARELGIRATLDPELEALEAACEAAWDAAGLNAVGASVGRKERKC